LRKDVAVNLDWLDDLAPDERIGFEQAVSLIEAPASEKLLAVAGRRRDAAHGDIVTYSRKVFIPLTKLCRDVCHYCTFARAPRPGERAYLTPEEALAIADAGRRAGCKEALFTLGDKPELRYRAARDELARLGHETTLSYLAEVAELVLERTGLLPHINAGVMSEEDLAMLRGVSISQGLMLESSAERLARRGGPHHGSPDKAPRARLETMKAAGWRSVPFTSGVLIGIGETRLERLEALFALRDLHDAQGHIQEIIVQNFRPKPGTRMAGAPAPSLDEHLWTIALTRLVFPASMNIQAPPNLSPDALTALVEAGINDWGGVSPVTPDHVNPEAAWPHLDELAATTRVAGKTLTERLAIYPAYAREASKWVDSQLLKPLYELSDADGFARSETWRVGRADEPPAADGRAIRVRLPGGRSLRGILDRAHAGQSLKESDIVALFRARGPEFSAVCAAADELRREVAGDVASYVVTRNINYTNICGFHCRFCAFSKGKLSENLRGRPYDLEAEEIAARVREAWARGATEVCMQGGIHPDYTGEKYLEICRVVKNAAPDIHIHAFSPLEVRQGAASLRVSVAEFLAELKRAGLGTLPGTAAEILDDEARAILCPDKLNTEQWLDVVRTAHTLGLRSTATIMFGHVDRYEHWARHLLRVRALQEETGGFTEFVPLPFVAMETPIYLKGRARPGPTFREAILMHAVARLALNPLIPNIQASWVKLGEEGLAACIAAGVNDLGGTLMDESISRAAGASHGREMTPQRLEHIARAAGRRPHMRTTLYRDAPEERRERAFAAARERAAQQDLELA
jgi:FO synthase